MRWLLTLGPGIPLDPSRPGMPISPAGPDGPSGPGKPYINKAKNKVIRDEPDAKVPISRFFW